ncbi:hypothetical protein V6Z11_A11G141500 [Gossypium hirsutum]
MFPYWFDCRDDGIYNKLTTDTLGPTRPASTLCSTLLNLPLLISFNHRKWS